MRPILVSAIVMLVVLSNFGFAAFAEVRFYWVSFTGMMLMALVPVVSILSVTAVYEKLLKAAGEQRLSERVEDGKSHS